MKHHFASYDVTRDAKWPLKGEVAQKDRRFNIEDTTKIIKKKERQANMH